MIKMAVVGAGLWGESHACVYRENPNAELVAVCDLNKEKAQNYAQKYQVPQVYSDYRDLLDKCDCDAVAIVTPDFLHADIAIACAQAGKHILIEKPLATTREDALAIAKAVDNAGVRAMVDMHNRWNPPFNIIRRLVASGKYGLPKSAYMKLTDAMWVATDMLKWASRSSILWFLGSHAIDTLSWIVDSEPEEVFAYQSEGRLKALGIDTVDMYQSAIKYKNGVISQVENGWITPNGNSCVNDFKFNLLCEKGKFDVDASSHNLLQVTTEDRFYTEDMLDQHYVFDKCEGFAYKSIHDFVDKLVSGEEFHVSMRESVNVVITILAIFESVKTGKPIKPQLI